MCVGAENEGGYYYDVQYLFPVLMSNVSCVGVEEKLIDCDYDSGGSGYSLVSLRCLSQRKFFLTVCSVIAQRWL